MSDLVVIEKTNVMTVFTDAKQIDPILEKIRNDAKSIVADVSTDKGRKEIASVAYKVAQAKSYLDGLGKDLVDELKEVPKKVDANRKFVRDFLDNLKEEVRQPLTDWESEQARIAAEKQAEAERIEAEKLAAIEAEKIAKQLENDHELGLLLNAEFDRTRIEEAKAKEQARIEYENKIAREAEEKAKAESEAKAKLEREESERKVIEAKLATERVEREKKEAEDKAIADAKEAARQAEISKEQAVIAERARLQKIADDEVKAAQAREADQNHKRAINQKIIAALVEHAGINEEQSKALITAIVKKQIPSLNINY